MSLTISVGDHSGDHTEIPLARPEDLAAVDRHVRGLCNTAAGAQCHSLLTQEYMVWRLKVGVLLCRTCERPPGEWPETFIAWPEAYMDGFLLKYRPHKCVVSLSQRVPRGLPLADAHAPLRKRKCAAPPE